MKTENSSLQHYGASSLRVIETDGKSKAPLRVLKREDSIKNQPFSFIANSSINDPGAWDASWFMNYE